MRLNVRTVAVGLSAIGLVGMVTLMSGVGVYYKSSSSHSTNDIADVLSSDDGGAIAGRIVSIPVKVYRDTFKATLKLGQCPLVMESSTIKTCSDEFTGNEVFLAKGGMTVDVSRVESSEDVTLHIMGGVGTSVGVLGLISVSPKVKVSVTTDTSKKALNLISSYEVNKGVVTLQNPKPKTSISDSALYLAEIELGGYETLLVTLEFESEAKRTEVEISVTFKILFWSITAKVNFVKTTFTSSARARIQFKSSWRQEQEKHFSNLDQALPVIEQMENMYMQGPEEMRDMSTTDDRSHNFYYFASWKQSPYGANMNLAVINHDLGFLGDQNTEMLSVLHRINILKDQSWTPDQRRQMGSLNTTLTQKTGQLTTGLNRYHTMAATDRQKLRDIYGIDRAPLFYTRELNNIVKE